MQKKRTNKSLMYVVTIVIMAVLTLGSIGLATWALLRTKLDIGGNISFNGTGNILAEISNGKINNEEKTGVMTGFTIGPDYDETANKSVLDTWTGLNLEFDEEGNDIVINFTVTNKDTEKTLLVETTPTFTSDKATMTVSAGGEETNKVFISPQEEKEYAITFHLLNTEEIVDATNFSVTLNMRNAKDSEIPVPAPTLDKLFFTLLDDDTYEVSIKDYFEIEGEIVIPAEYEGKKVSTVGNFGGSIWITSVYIPQGVTKISANAFGQIYEGSILYCRELSYVKIPNSVVEIGDSAFEMCGNLKHIIIPSSVTSIGNRVFQECSSLTEITIPSSVTSIGDGAFYACHSLTEITIPSSVTSIGNQAFNDCSKLTNITFEKSSGTFQIDTNAFYNVPPTATVNFSGATWTSGDLSYTDADNVQPSDLQGKTWTITK